MMYIFFIEITVYYVRRRIGAAWSTKRVETRRVTIRDSLAVIRLFLRIVRCMLFGLSNLYGGGLPRDRPSPSGCCSELIQVRSGSYQLSPVSGHSRRGDNFRIRAVAYVLSASLSRSMYSLRLGTP